MTGSIIDVRRKNCKVSCCGWVSFAVLRHGTRHDDAIGEERVFFELGRFPACRPIDDAVFRYLLSGEAKTLDEAEEKFLYASLRELFQLCAGLLSEEELAEHPLMIRTRGSHGWEES